MRAHPVWPNHDSASHHSPPDRADPPGRYNGTANSRAGKLGTGPGGPHSCNAAATSACSAHARAPARQPSPLTGTQQPDTRMMALYDVHHPTPSGACLPHRRKTTSRSEALHVRASCGHVPPGTQAVSQAAERSLAVSYYAPAPCISPAMPQLLLRDATQSPRAAPASVYSTASPRSAQGASQEEVSHHLERR